MVLVVVVYTVDVV
jgi:hypothetical protein